MYRGEEIPGLQGTYLYSDYCGAGVRGLQVDGDTVIDTRTWDLPIDKEYSFGQDDAGEIYVLLAGGRVVKLVTPEEAESRGRRSGAEECAARDAAPAGS